MAYLPNFPNVPKLLGVPPVLRNPGELINAAQILLSGDVLGIFAFFSKRGQWGVFDQSGVQVLNPTSIKGVDYQHSWRVANYPMERGAFQAYNKVQTPFNAPVTMMISGSPQEINDFLTTLEFVADSIALYNIVTPEYVYTNVSIEHIDYRRTAANGLTMLTVDIHFTQIRVTAPASYTNAASPQLSSQVNGGLVQPAPVTVGNPATALSTGALIAAGASVVAAARSQLKLSPSSTSFLNPSSVLAITSTLMPYSVVIMDQLANTPTVTGVSSAVLAQLPSAPLVQ